MVIMLQNEYTLNTNNKVGSQVFSMAFGIVYSLILFPNFLLTVLLKYLVVSIAV